ncbi:LmbU family transcriptional regulator [Kribbella speibonae]|uniref:LmbU family transcriptional regulator n=1 Tax=Kribbella speibonae TaxID=1572660 RepID=UPI00192E2968|nr:LmbU family transcriptional regulator [Kribbella speibonae]
MYAGISGELPHNEEIGSRIRGTISKKAPICLRRSGLVFSGSPTFRVWEVVGLELLRAANSSAWWIADWLAYGESTFQDRYQEAVRKTSLSYQTLRNYAWVARQFALPRRRDNLSFGHHAEVAALDPPEQDYWLRNAEEFAWSRNKLRAEVRASLRERQGPKSTVNVGEASAEPTRISVSTGAPSAADNIEDLRIKISQKELSRLTFVASSHGFSLEEWVIQVLNFVSSNTVQAETMARAINRN